MSDLDLDAIRRVAEQDRLRLPPYVWELLAEVDRLRAGRSQLFVEMGGLRDQIARRAAEVERLKANQQPDGGEWHTVYGWHGTKGKWWRAEAPDVRGDGDNVKRRVWYGPVEPITEAAE